MGSNRLGPRHGEECDGIAICPAAPLPRMYSPANPRPCPHWCVQIPPPSTDDATFQLLDAAAADLVRPDPIIADAPMPADPAKHFEMGGTGPSFAADSDDGVGANVDEAAKVDAAGGSAGLTTPPSAQQAPALVPIISGPVSGAAAARLY